MLDVCALRRGQPRACTHAGANLFGDAGQSPARGARQRQITRPLRVRKLWPMSQHHRSAGAGQIPAPDDKARSMGALPGRSSQSAGRFVAVDLILAPDFAPQDGDQRAAPQIGGVPMGV